MKRYKITIKYHNWFRKPTVLDGNIVPDIDVLVNKIKFDGTYNLIYTTSNSVKRIISLVGVKEVIIEPQD